MLLGFSKMIKIKKIRTIVYRYPLDIAVKTSFGTMKDRPMILVQVHDDLGNEGWGEIWCNFPNIGAEHRAKLVDSVISPILLSKAYEDAKSVFDDLTKQTKVLGIQSGEYGPLAQCVAGIDIAIHDLIGKRNGTPIWKLLGGKTSIVPAYASGINPTQAKEMGIKALNLGFNKLKLKIGFGNDLDLKNLSILREIVGSEGSIMADVNQGWSIETALDRIGKLDQFHLDWLEEPILADRPYEEWKKLTDICSMPLAAGENIVGRNLFQSTINERIISVIQPDLAKWGGFTCCVPIAKDIIDAGLRYCPHYLGGGIGLIASAHALAAVGGTGILEVDINENPLRTNLLGELLNLSPGQAVLGNSPGLGIDPDLKSIEKYRVPH